MFTVSVVGSRTKIFSSSRNAGINVKIRVNVVEHVLQYNI